LGIRFGGAIENQAEGKFMPGRRIEKGDSLLLGDLLYISKKDRSKISHVVIYLNENEIIDAHDGNVSIRPFKGWHKSHYEFARRIIE